MKVFLDDIRKEPEGWVRTHNYEETIELLEGGEVEELSLDHDLGPFISTKTGYDVMKWIEEQVHTNPDFVLPQIQFHTANPSGRRNMKACLDSIKNFLEKE